MLNIVYLALGSNVGDREGYIDQAIQLLNDIEDIEVTQFSDVIETKADASFSQPDYLNAVVEIKTLLSCRDLFQITLTIECRLNRHSKGNKDPRTIDLDILLFNQDIIADDDLVVPHPMCHERDFVLKPLQQIAGDFVHPLLGVSINDIILSGVV